jgi:hypothetical protein
MQLNEEYESAEEMLNDKPKNKTVTEDLLLGPSTHFRPYATGRTFWFTSVRRINLHFTKHCVATLRLTKRYVKVKLPLCSTN